MFTLYDRIARMCDEKGIKPAKMCLEIGISKGNMTELKMGRTKTLSQKTLLKIANYFNVSVDYLLGNDYHAEVDDLVYEIARAKKLYEMETDPDKKFQIAIDIDNLNEAMQDIVIANELIESGQKNSPTPLNMERVAAMAPVLGKIPAGYPAYSVEEVLGYQPVPEDIPRPEECFFLEVSGDSMIGAGIYPGDRVLIRHQDCAENGQIVAFRVNGDDATLKRLHYQGEQVVLVPANDKYAPIIIPAAQLESGEAAILGVALTVTHKL